jgi:SAM-dependent methyltransferase
MKLNLGCGNSKITGCINVDREASVRPDVLADPLLGLPFKSGTIDSCFFFHTIEHIEKRKWPALLLEIHRVLKTDGTLIVSYPEFSKILNNWLTNALGKRDFWEATIYGRQLYSSDYHVAALDSDELRTTMFMYGFKELEFKPEPQESYNTVLKCKKGNIAITYEELLYKAVWQ